MQTVLQQINTLPDVIGSILCNSKGQLLAHAFPPLFDETILTKAAAVIAEGPLSQAQSVSAGMLDLRYGEGRVIARKLEGGVLMVLCTKSINPQVLTISLNVARNRLEPLLAEHSLPAEAASPGVETTLQSIVLSASHLDNSRASQSFNQLGMVGINHNMAKRIMDCFAIGTCKKLTLTNQATGLSGSFPIMIINDEESKFDDKIILSPSFEKKLQASAGDSIIVTL